MGNTDHIHSQQPTVIYPDLKGKTVLVTGSNRGIGKAISLEFLRQDCELVAVYRKDKPDFAGVAEDAKVIYLECDITVTDKIAEWIAGYEAKGGSVDILVNNAGCLLRNALLDVTSDEWDTLFATNAKAAFFLSQRCAQHMGRHGGGVIINASSFAARMPSIPSAIYAATKAALLSLTKSMAAEWAPHGIRVNSFSPGVVETDMTRPAIARNREEMLDQLSLRRFGSAREVATAVAFLASDSASYISGTDLEITGGKLVIQNPGDGWVDK